MLASQAKKNGSGKGKMQRRSSNISQAQATDKQASKVTATPSGEPVSASSIHGDHKAIQDSPNPGHQSNQQNTDVDSTTDASFITEWCVLSGLDRMVASCLESRGYTTGRSILTMHVDDIRIMYELDDTRKYLLRTSVLDYHQNRMAVDKQLASRGVVFRSEPDSKRDPKDLWRISKNAVTMGTVVKTWSQEHGDVIRDLRRLLSERRQTPNGAYKPNNTIVQPSIQDLKLEEDIDGGNSDGNSSDGSGSRPCSQGEDDSKLDLERSKSEMEKAIYALDDELFTEEEKRLIVKVKDLERVYEQNGDKRALSKGMNDLVDDMAFKREL